jgi:hypothetical protein
MKVNVALLTSFTRMTGRADDRFRLDGVVARCCCAEP